MDKTPLTESEMYALLAKNLSYLRKSQGGLSQKAVARIVQSISEYCRENLITDGCCGVRELISWVQSYMVCGDIREAAHYTILPSATADAISRAEVEESCLDTVLPS